MKFNSQIGVAFFSVLVFMQIIAVLSVCMISAVLLETRMTQDFSRHELIFHAAEQGLTQAEQTLSADCQLPIMTVAALSSAPLRWWQGRPLCAGNFQQFKYYYVVEFLGHDACAMLLPDKTATADDYRVTVLAVDPAGNDKVILQTTWIKPSRVPVSCAGVVHMLQAGQQSWREI